MNNQEIIEELFCLKFENKTLADIYFRNEAERWVYSYMFDVTEREHLERYQFVTKDTQNKNVLDIACGSGYGSYIIANEGKAKQIIAVDLSEDSIRYGNHRFPNPKITRLVGDAQEVVKESEYDVIVSFETIEHLPQYEKFLKNMSISLKDDGFFYVSTPIVNKTSTICKNPFHVIEWSFEDFHSLINKYFVIDEIYLQNIFFHSQRLKKTFFGKLLQRKSKYVTPKTILFEKYNSQIKLNNIKEGYQMLKCKKR